MTVSELIQELQKYRPDLTVLLTTIENWDNTTEAIIAVNEGSVTVGKIEVI